MRSSRRVMLSLACVPLAITVLFFLSIRSVIGHHTQPLEQFLRNSAEIFPVYFLFALPGWLVALPFVILIKNAEGWRAWAILITGVSIGPGLILLPGLIGAHGRFTWPGDSFALAASLCVSFFTTISYILALRFAHRRSVASRQ